MQTTSIIPGLQTEQASQSFTAALADRQAADYKCFQILEQLSNQLFIMGDDFVDAFAAGLEATGREMDDRSRDELTDLISRAREAISDRRDADNRTIQAILNRR